jgi:DNA polymerase-3 subunit beta
MPGGQKGIGNMKVTIATKRFLDGINAAAAVAPATSNIPIITCLLIEAGINYLKITATDLEKHLEYMIDDIAVDEPGKCCVSAKWFRDVIARTTGEKIELKSDEKRLNVQSGGGEYSFALWPVLDFPVYEPLTSAVNLQIDPDDLLTGFDRTMQTVDKYDSRKALHGILLDGNADDRIICFVATDGKRLAVSRCGYCTEHEEDIQAIMPLETAKVIRRVFSSCDEPIEVDLNNRKIAFDSGRVYLCSKLIEGNYPNYQHVIPPEFSNKIVLPVKAIKNRIELMKAVADNNSNLEMTFVNNTLELKLSRGCEVICVEHLKLEYSGKPVSFTVNPEFMLQGFNAAKEVFIELKYNDSKSPFLLEKLNSYQYLLMPMRNKEELAETPVIETDDVVD